MNKERNVSLDILKGLGIILVILGHIIGLSYTNPWDLKSLQMIYAFHMPMFFIISGYIYSIKRPEFNKSRLIKNIKRFLIPYFVWLLIFYPLIYSTLNSTYSNLIPNFLKWIESPDTAWFIYIMFFTTTLLLLMIKLEKKLKNLSLIFFFVIFLTLRLLINYSILNTSFNPMLFYVADYFIYSLAGYIWGRFLEDKVKRHDLLIFIVTVILFISKFFLVPQYISFHHPITIYVVDFITAISGSYIFYFIATKIKNIKLVSNVILWIGICSLEFYLIHPMFMYLEIGDRGLIRLITGFISCVVFTGVFILILKKAAQRYSIINKSCNLVFGTNNFASA